MTPRLPRAGRGFGDSLLAHYAHRLPALEHRQLLSLLMLPRTPGMQIVFVTSLLPERRVLDYYLSLVPPGQELWPLGFKSNGRRLMRSVGVPLSLGQEDVRSVEEAVSAAEAIRREHPDVTGVVIKSDNSGTGDGNRVIRFADARGRDGLRRALESWNRGTCPTSSWVRWSRSSSSVPGSRARPCRSTSPPEAVSRSSPPTTRC